MWVGYWLLLEVKKNGQHHTRQNWAELGPESGPGNWGTLRARTHCMHLFALLPFALLPFALFCPFCPSASQVFLPHRTTPRPPAHSIQLTLLLTSSPILLLIRVLYPCGDLGCLLRNGHAQSCPEVHINAIICQFKRLGHLSSRQL